MSPPDAPWHPYAPLAPLMPHPHPQYRHLVVKSGTTAGQHDIWSACGSGWCLVRCTFSPSPPCPLMSPGRGIWWPRVVWTCISLTWTHVQLSAVFNRPSWLFKGTPPPQVQASSGKEQYYMRSDWHLVSLGSGWPVYVRVNLVWAARVIPAPWADIKVVIVKKLICYCLQFSIDCL